MSGNGGPLIDPDVLGAGHGSMSGPDMVTKGGVGHVVVEPQASTGSKGRLALVVHPADAL